MTVYLCVLVGATNYNGEPPFTCVTCEGTIEGCGGSSEISVSFTPDHQSSSYADTMYIDLNGHVSMFVGIILLSMLQLIRVSGVLSLD